MVGFTVTDNGNGTVTITKSGTEDSTEFRQWFATAGEGVQVLMRLWVEGKRGAAPLFADAPYRRVTRTSITLNPSTFTTAQAHATPMGPSDAQAVVNT